MSVTLETWKLAETLEDARAAYKAKSVEMATLEKKGLVTEQDWAAFGKVQSERHKLGEAVRSAASARDLIEATVPLALRQERERAEMKAREAGSTVAKAQRAFSIQVAVIEGLVRDAQGSNAHDHVIEAARKELKGLDASLSAAKDKLKEATDLATRAANAARPKRPKS